MKAIKRYWLFLGTNYYATGGIHDFHKSYKFLTEAKKAAESWMKTRFDPSDNWWHVVDVTTGKIVAKSEYQAHGAPSI